VGFHSEGVVRVAQVAHDRPHAELPPVVRTDPTRRAATRLRVLFIFIPARQPNRLSFDAGKCPPGSRRSASNFGSCGGVGSFGQRGAQGHRAVSGATGAVLPPEVLLPGQIPTQLAK
jgi:hypothetical protein